jgi:hypothetical protein
MPLACGDSSAQAPMVREFASRWWIMCRLCSGILPGTDSDEGSFASLVTLFLILLLR